MRRIYRFAQLLVETALRPKGTAGPNTAALLSEPSPIMLTRQTALDLHVSMSKDEIAEYYGLSVADVEAVLEARA